MAKQQQRTQTQQTQAPQAPEKKTNLQVVKDNRTVTHEQIEKRAYELYVQRGYQNGHHEEDWLRAEVELRARA